MCFACHCRRNPATLFRCDNPSENTETREKSSGFFSFRTQQILCHHEVTIRLKHIQQCNAREACRRQRFASVHVFLSQCRHRDIIEQRHSMFARSTCPSRGGTIAHAKVQKSFYEGFVNIWPIKSIRIVIISDNLLIMTWSAILVVLSRVNTESTTQRST